MQSDFMCNLTDATNKMFDLLSNNGSELSWVETNLLSHVVENF